MPKNFQEIPLEKLVINHDENMRGALNEESLENLAASIKARGLINPITVIPEDGGKYKVVAGFRRSEASKRAGLQTISAVVKPKDTPQADLMMIQLAENVDREDTTVWETANLIEKIKTETGDTYQEVAKKLNKSASWVSNYVGVFKLPKNVQEMAKDGKLGVAQVRLLSTFAEKLDEKKLAKMAEKVSTMDQAQLDAVREKVSAKLEAKGGGKKGRAKKAKAVSEAEVTEAVTVATAETAVEADPYAGMRKRSSITAAIQFLNKQYDEADRPDTRHKLIGQVEALNWALGDETVDLGMDKE